MTTAVPTTASSADPNPGSTASEPPEGLSAFIARVLDQLSVSAWLPAGALVGGTFAVLKLRANEGATREALTDIGDTSLPALVLLGLAVIVVTSLTQAFEFGAIKVLEGYWGSGPIGSLLARPGSWWHGRRSRDAAGRRRELRYAAFLSARSALRLALEAQGMPAEEPVQLVRYMEADILDVPAPPLPDRLETRVRPRPR